VKCNPIMHVSAPSAWQPVPVTPPFGLVGRTVITRQHILTNIHHIPRNQDLRLHLLSGRDQNAHDAPIVAYHNITPTSSQLSAVTGTAAWGVVVFLLLRANNYLRRSQTYA
jgi:hypothetical protein